MMQSKLSLLQMGLRPASLPAPLSFHRSSIFSGGSPTTLSRRRTLRWKLVRQSLNDKWKLSDIDAGSVQEQVTSWLSKTQTFLREATSLLVKSSQSRNPDAKNVYNAQDMGEIFEGEWTVE